VQLLAGAQDVMVSSPGRNHSHQTALALYAAGRLAGYWSGIPARPSRFPAPFKAIKHRLGRYTDVDLPKDKCHTFMVLPAVGAMLGLAGAQGGKLYHQALYAFDFWLSRAVRRLRPTAVLCAENSALRTFETARSLGIFRILDAASYHHTFQERFLPTDDSVHFRRRVNRRKDREVEMADLIITASARARRSYVDAGVDCSKVVSVPVGVDIGLFSYHPLTARCSREPVNFIFVGRATVAKGANLLCQALERLGQCGLDYRLTIVGDIYPEVAASVARLGDRVEHVARVEQPALVGLLRKADCMVVPSLFDSFAMVVAEALAIGRPVIVSDNVGASEFVEPGASGWVVPTGDVDRLTDRLRWCIENPDQLRQMGAAARRAGERCSWDRYRRALVSVIDRHVVTSVARHA
jgi:glycosyltransferase involved in cell wall biosynthesis